MPLYSYKCPDCGEYLELNRPMEERDAETECPRCSGLLKRKWGVGGVVIR